MSIHWELVLLVLALSLDGQVHTGKIYGGHEAVPHSRPYMVLLVRYMEDGNQSHCGGFLVNEDFVMTAAHCTAKSYRVLLGLHKYPNLTGVQQIDVVEIFPNNDYNKSDYRDDIMLLKLSSKAHFNENVKPIDIADQGDGVPKSCIVSGWGNSDKNIIYMSQVLMEVNVTLIDSKVCSINNLYCSEGESGPAEGDSGGPLVCENGKAYGIVSHKYIPVTGGPTMYLYTKIPDSKSWLKLAMKSV